MLSLQSESINLDPKLKEACGADVEQYCSNVSPGNSQVSISIHMAGYKRIATRVSVKFQTKKKKRNHDFKSILNNIQYLVAQQLHLPIAV